MMDTALVFLAHGLPLILVALFALTQWMDSD